MTRTAGSSLVESLLLCLFITSAALAVATHYASSYRAIRVVRGLRPSLSSPALADSACRQFTLPSANEILSRCENDGGSETTFIVPMRPR